MSLIKNIQADRLARDAIVLDLGDLGRQAERILGDAREEARVVIEAAQLEARKLIDTADARGYAEGQQRGREEGCREGERQGRQETIAAFHPQIEQLVSSWTAALERWETDRSELFLAARQDVLGFAFAVARKIVLRTVETDPTIVEDQLAEALSLVGRPSIVAVTINPKERATVEAVLPQLLSKLSQCEQVTVRDDESVNVGGCVVAVAGGEIDATIDTQLERIAQTLLASGKRSLPGDSAAP